jgi:hypothetical protein
MSGIGSELEEARNKFQEEISGVQNLRMTLSSALERLRIESDMLQREEAVLHEHEERMIASFEHLKVKEAHYKEKGGSWTRCLWLHLTLMIFFDSSSCCR